MKKRKLGSSDLEITEIAFGAWAIGGWMWGGADANDAVRAIETAIDNGMTTIDTASIYGFGLSEELVGKAVRGKRDKTQILTKFGMSWSGNKGTYHFSSRDNNGKQIDIYKYAAKEKVLKDCEDSLRRLGTDVIDLFQIHWPDASIPVSETMEALEMLVSQGKIRAGGVCNYPVDQLIEARKTFPVASDQVPFSMVKRDIEKDVIPYCLQNDMGILAYSPMQRGLLTGKIRPGHKFNEGDSRPDTPYYKEPNYSNILVLLDRIRPIADGHKVTLSQLVLNWTIQQPGITCALAGARNPQQTLENIEATDFNLTQDEISVIDKFIAETNIDTNI